MSRLIWMVAAMAASAGCRQILGLDDLVAGDGGPDVSDAGDASDAPIQCADWVPRSGHFSPCSVPPGAPLELAATGTWSYDTGTGELHAPDGEPVSTMSYLATVGTVEVRILSTDQFTILPEVTMRVTGTRPLLVASWRSANISGTIDASSTRTGAVVDAGAGANAAACDTAENGQGSGDAGGGGGGGFGGPGGDGGSGKNGQNAGGRGASALPTPQMILGGCAGANGGIATSAGKGGPGGGAIEIASPRSIRVEGVIHAGGAGGGGASGGGGGGGGGAGGYVGLDAPEVTVRPAGRVASNGGGGGAGCGSGSGAAGSNGAPGGQPAPGGPGTSCSAGTTGGEGGAAGQERAGNGVTGSSGGGAGGGVGYVLVWTSTWSNAGLVSPDPVQL